MSNSFSCFQENMLLWFTSKQQEMSWSDGGFLKCLPRGTLMFRCVRASSKLMVTCKVASFPCDTLYQIFGLNGWWNRPWNFRPWYELWQKRKNLQFHCNTQLIVTEIFVIPFQSYRLISQPLCPLWSQECDLPWYSLESSLPLQTHTHQTTNVAIECGAQPSPQATQTSDLLAISEYNKKLG